MPLTADTAAREVCDLLLDQRDPKAWHVSAIGQMYPSASSLSSSPFIFSHDRTSAGSWAVSSGQLMTGQPATVNKYNPRSTIESPYSLFISFIVGPIELTRSIVVNLLYVYLAATQCYC